MGWICFGFGVLAVLVALVAWVCAKPHHCHLCGNPLRSSEHKQEIDGRQVACCHECNARLRNRNSRAALKTRGLI